MKVTVFPLAFYILLKNQEIRGTDLSPLIVTFLPELFADFRFIPYLCANKSDKTHERF